MTRGSATGPEQAIDGFSATLFALCVGWCLHALGSTPIGVVGGAAVAGVVVLVLLGRVGGAARGAGFEPVALDYDEAVDDTLLLEDRLVEPDEDSQVVRLFAVGSGRGPHVPGELAHRIDRFLSGPRAVLQAAPVQPDAAQELYEALADIRRTLR